MNHTPQIKKAIEFASHKHRSQLRKGALQLPYITHPFSVALLVAEGGGNDEAVIAALLHDTLEDTETTEEEIAEAFGPRVLELVRTVSEPKTDDGRELSWKEKKDGYLEQIEVGPLDALLVAIADKIDNIESKVEALAIEGSELLKRWAQAPLMYLWYHEASLEIAKKRLPEHPLTKRLTEALSKEREALNQLNISN